MRTAVTFSLFVLALSFLAAPAAAGQTRLTACDRVAAPGETIRTSVELVNDSDRAVRVKVIARVRGDKERASGKAAKVRGKKRKYTIRLGAGERVVKDLDLPVPDKALGPMLVDLKVRWPKKGRVLLSESAFALPDEANEEQSDPGSGRDEPDLLTFTGTVTLTRADPPDWKGGTAMSGMPLWYPGDLELKTADGDTWWLVGYEAHVLARLMVEAGLDATRATVSGFPCEWFVCPDGDAPQGNVKALRAEDTSNVLVVLEFDAEGIDDPRARIVRHRHVLDGPLSKIHDARELVVGTRDEWDRLLDSAGIRVPDLPEPPERPDPDDPTWPGEPGNPGNLGAGECCPDQPWYRAPWEVDFERETVVAVFAGDQRSTGYGVRIVKVTKEDDGSLLVSYAVTEPSKYEVVAEVVTQPFAIAAIEKTDAEIRFAKVDDPGWDWDDGWPSPIPMNGGR